MTYVHWNQSLFRSPGWCCPSKGSFVEDLPMYPINRFAPLPHEFSRGGSVAQGLISMVLESGSDPS
jgi:hypothetical protein